jgi:hypothetical protein
MQVAKDAQLVRGRHRNERRRCRQLTVASLLLRGFLSTLTFLIASD